MRIYLDASPIVYLVEQRTPYAANVLSRINVAGTELATSDLALLEALVIPLRQNKAALVKDFDDFFARQIAVRVGFTEAIFRKAADIRAQAQRSHTRRIALGGRLGRRVRSLS